MPRCAARRSPHKHTTTCRGRPCPIESSVDPPPGSGPPFEPGSTDMKTIFICFGTRPEAIKMAPVVRELQERDRFRVVTCLTGQHREMLDQVIQLFALPVDHDLDIMRRTQSLTHITSAVLEGLEPILTAESPDLVLVHGDTTTTFAAALAAFYQEIPVAHVEAGLRTANLYNPYPEEANRRLADRLSAAHYAPTPAARDALLSEGLGPESILVTGNTVIDALLETSKSSPPEWSPEIDDAWDRPGTKILVTVHRRESQGAPMESITRASARGCREYPRHTLAIALAIDSMGAPWLSLRCTVTRILVPGRSQASSISGDHSGGLLFDVSRSASMTVLPVTNMLSGPSPSESSASRAAGVGA